MSNLRGFTLNSSDENFMQRQQDVFHQLKVLENNRKNTSICNEDEMEVDEPRERNRGRNRSSTKQFRGKESIFKKPQNPAPKNYFRGMPDFKKNPHKWTKYSLDDVRDEDISDKGNTKAALTFLKELENRKFVDDEPSNKNIELPTKIVFNKHSPISKQNEESDDNVSFFNSKLIMPEYVVGQKIKKDRKNRKLQSERGAELKLDHLFDDEDDE